ncbi:MAG: DUF4013 domain-containing protein [Anaerolineae bacterium]|nr:DUF4013 domain-containing protein [Anaerolineae bacterium]MDW8099454.1 DUF4013 domain-containing protein [Anaerolineae bacterium]
MDIGKAFGFVFEDPEWLIKVLVGGLVILGGVLLSPILVGFFLLFVLEGYSIQLLKNVRDGLKHPLPRWDNWGDKAVKGLKLFVIFLIWAIPIIAVSLVSFVISALAADNQDLTPVAAAASICLACVSFLWGIWLAVLSPAICVRFAETEQISAGFELSRLLAFIRDNLGDIIVAVLISLVASIVALIAGFILCAIGLLFTGFWAGLVQFHLFGQIARRDAARRAASPVMA